MEEHSVEQTHQTSGLVKGSPLPAGQHVVRYIPPRFIETDDDENTVILGGAFLARTNEGNEISCNWLEYFNGPIDAQVDEIRKCSRLNYAAKGRLALLAVDQTCLHVQTESTEKRDITVIYDPLGPEGTHQADESHSLIKNVPSVEDEKADDIGDLIAECVINHFPAQRK